MQAGKRAIANIKSSVVFDILKDETHIGTQ